MHAIKIIALLLGGALLGGACSTVESRLEQSKTFCTDLGYRAATDEWKDCVVDLEVAWRHGRFRAVGTTEARRRFCADIGYAPDTDDLRFCMAELQASADHGRTGGASHLDRHRCQDLGFAEGTDQFRRCVVIFEVAHRHRMSIRPSSR